MACVAATDSLENIPENVTILIKKHLYRTGHFQLPYIITALFQPCTFLFFSQYENLANDFVM